MKYFSLIILGFLFQNLLVANPLPDLEAPTHILEIDSYKFLPTYLRGKQLFHSSSSEEKLPISAFFKSMPIKLNSKGQFRAWAYEDLAFFCKIEVQLEKAAKMPIKFRLGEVQEVERLEGKYE